MSDGIEATDFLTHQHRELESALREALSLEPGAARRKRFLEAADALTIHIASEEQVFYPAVHRDPTEDILLESLEEHLSLKRLVADLIQLAGDAPTFEPKLHVLLEQAEHHHREEEEKLFPRSRSELSAERLEGLGREMAALQRELLHEGKPRKAVLDQTDAAEPLK